MLDCVFIGFEPWVCASWKSREDVNLVPIPGK